MAGAKIMMRDSDDPTFQFPSSIFFCTDFPLKDGILIDSIFEQVVVRRGLIIDHFSYDEWKSKEIIDKED